MQLVKVVSGCIRVVKYTLSMPNDGPAFKRGHTIAHNISRSVCISLYQVFT
jgi:hypothetical protein